MESPLGHGAALQQKKMKKLIENVEIPEFGSFEQIPELPAHLFETRLDALRSRMESEALDVLLVYSDREHSANLAWCTGFDPRFEEALFILTREGQRTLCVGNECINVLADLPVRTEVRLFQDFSLMGQDRSKSLDLAALLEEAGLVRGMRCGIAGWKTLSDGRIEVPSYIIEITASVSGALPVNSNDLFMSPRDGLRIVNEPEQLAAFEYAASQTSGSVLRILRALEPGASCAKLSDHFLCGGLPHSCHPMLACGETISNGMASPGNTRLERGNFLTCAFGVWGALNCRAGLAAVSPEAFEADQRGRDTWAVIENYLAVVRAWYAALRVGVSAGEVWAAAEAARDDSLFTFCVNPGHYIHLDEWVSSPFYKNSDIPLPSGCALQADVIPVSRVPGISINMEDGLILADEPLRQTLAQLYPAMFERMQARRRFMIDTLGYELSEDVLPVGNMPGAYFPCLLDTRLVVRHA